MYVNIVVKLIIKYIKHSHKNIQKMTQISPSAKKISKMLRKQGKPANLYQLKKGIDIRIQAILNYLQNDQNFLNCNINLDNTNKNTLEVRKSEEYGVSTCETFNYQNKRQSVNTDCQSQTQRESQYFICNKKNDKGSSDKARNSHQICQSFKLQIKRIMDNTQVADKQSVQPDELEQLSIIDDDKVVLLNITNKILQQKQDVKQSLQQSTKVQQSIDYKPITSLTPKKIQQMQPQSLRNSGKTDKSSQSLTKQIIQSNASLKIFGAALTNSLQNISNFDSLLYNVETRSNKKGSSKDKQNCASGSKKSIRNKQNMDSEQTPCDSAQVSRTKYNIGKKTPGKRTPLDVSYSQNQYSTAKRLVQYFAGFDRIAQPITSQIMHKMKQQIDQITKKTRKQAQDNNVRAKLLKRIQSCKVKINDFVSNK